MNMIPQNKHLDLISSLSFLGSKPCPLLPFLKFTWFFKSKTFMNMFPQKSTIQPHFFLHSLFPQQQVSPSRPSADLWNKWNCKRGNSNDSNNNLALVAACDSNESSSFKHSSTCFHKNKITQMILQAQNNHEHVSTNTTIQHS